MVYKRQPPKETEELRGGPRLSDETAPQNKADILRLSLPTMDEDPMAFEVYITMDELADRWRVTKGGLRNMVDSGFFPFWVKVHRTILFPLSEILRHERKRAEEADVSIRERRKKYNANKAAQKRKRIAVRKAVRKSQSEKA